MNEELKIIIKAEIDNIQKNLNAAKKKLQDFGKKTKETLKEVSKVAQEFGEKCKTGLAVVGGAVAGAGAALLAMSASTEEFRRNQAKLETTFREAGGSARKAQQTYNDLYRVLGDDGQATEAAAHIAQLTTNHKHLSEWTTICQGAYATFGDSMPIESLTEAANETAKTGALTGALADALNWCGVSEDDFQKKLDACNTESEREALIRQTLNGLYGEAAKSYESTAASILAQNEAQARLTSSMASIGAAVAPIQTALTNFGATIMEMLAPYIQEFCEKHLTDLVDILDKVALAIEAAISWVIDNWELVSSIAEVVLTIVAAFAAYSTAMKAVNAVSALFSGSAGLIIAGIMLIIAAIVLCIKYWDEIKAFVIETWDKISNWVSKTAKSIGESVSNLAKNIGVWFKSMYDKILNTKLGDLVKTIFDGIVNDIKIKINLAKTIVSNVIGLIKGVFTGDFEAVKNSVSNIFTAIKDSIKEKLTNAKNTVSTIIDKVKSLLGFDGFSWELPKPKLPHFSVSGGKAPWGFMGEGSLPKISIDWYAKGGVFDSATLFAYGSGSIGGLGEKGAEMVAPLENNLGWLDKLAGMLDERMNGHNTPIVLTVDGKVFAETAVNTINKKTRQDGKLALNLV